MPGRGSLQGRGAHAGYSVWYQCHCCKHGPDSDVGIILCNSWAMSLSCSCCLCCSLHVACLDCADCTGLGEPRRSMAVTRVLFEGEPGSCPLTPFTNFCIPTRLFGAYQVNSAFHPFGVGKWIVMHVITWITGWRPLNGRPGLCMAVWP